MGGKWLEILKEISPSISRVAVIYNPDNPVMAENLKSVQLDQSWESRWPRDPAAVRKTLNALSVHGALKQMLAS
jgi:hypothetical protein